MRKDELVLCSQSMKFIFCREEVLPCQLADDLRDFGTELLRRVQACADRCAAKRQLLITTLIKLP